LPSNGSICHNIYTWLSFVKLLTQRVSIVIDFNSYFTSIENFRFYKVGYISPLLKSVTRKRLEKTVQAGENLACSDL
jgi:hypothetical protein